MLVTRLFQFIIFCSLLIPQQIFAQDSTAITIGYTHSIYSKLLKENRSYWVYLPKSYQDKAFTSNKYPVMVLLDGDTHFHSATGVVQFLAADHKIPEMIVVGVLNTDRTRDLTPTHTELDNDGKVQPQLKTSGGGDRFLAFLSEELLPHIDSMYRTLPYRLMVGHSAGGSLAAHDFISEEPMCNAYLAFDPNVGWDNSITIRHLKAQQVFPRKKTGRFYLSLAHNTDAPLDTTNFRKAQDQFCAELKTAGLPDSCFKADYFEQENHRSIPLISLYHGLLFTFHGFYQKNPENLDLAGLKKHYEQISKRWQVQFLPVEKNVNDHGYYHLYTTKNLKKALTYFTYNTELYPLSFNAWDSLAEYYMVSGDHKKAKLYYQKSLDLNPKNEGAVKMLQKLK